MGIVGRVRNYVVGVAGGIAGVERTIEELEARAENVEFDLYREIERSAHYMRAIGGIRDKLISQRRMNARLSNNTTVLDRRISMVLRDLREIKLSAGRRVAAAISGDKTRVKAEEIIRPFHINVGLVGIAQDALAESKKAGERVEIVEREKRGMMAELAFYEKNLHKDPALAYIDGKVHGTRRFGKHCRSVALVEREMRADGDLQNAFEKGWAYQGTYGGMNIIFEGGKAGSIPVGYFVPNGKGRRVELFANAGMRAVGVLSKVFKGDVYNVWEPGLA